MARTFTDTGNDRIEVASAAHLVGDAAFSIVCWFKCTGTSGNNFIYSESAAFNIKAQVYVQATNGDVVFFSRTPTGIAEIISASTGFDDDGWHRLLAARTASNAFELFIDGSSEGTDSTEIGTDTGTPTIYIGNNAQPLDEGLDGEIARLATFKVGLTVQQADSFLYSGVPPDTLELWAELIGTTTEPDWSGNNHALTMNGSPLVADHAPVASPWAGNNDAVIVVPPPVVGGINPIISDAGIHSAVFHGAVISG